MVFDFSTSFGKYLGIVMLEKISAPVSPQGVYAGQAGMKELEEFTLDG